MREGLFEHHRLDSVTITGASLAGLVQGEKILGPVPQGYAWYVENVAFVVKGNSHTAACWFAVTPDDGPLGGAAGGLAAWDGQGMIVPLAGAIASDYFCYPAAYVGPGHVLHVLASAAQGGTFAVGDQVTATVQIAVHQIDPQHMTSPEDALQVLESHERLGAELARSAVAERRAV